MKEIFLHKITRNTAPCGQNFYIFLHVFEYVKLKLKIYHLKILLYFIL